MTLVETMLLGLQGILGVAMAGAGGTKLAGAETHVEDFERFGYPQWFRLATGSVEVLAALGLLLAFVTSPPLALAGGALTVLVLGGALLTHVRTGDPLSDAVPAAALLVVGLAVVWNHLGTVV